MIIIVQTAACNRLLNSGMTNYRIGPHWTASDYIRLLGLDRYRAGARYPIPHTIGRIYTDTDSDTDTWLYKFFVLKM